ncbi:MAG: DUF1850 domain-containing protein [Desulfobacteraceae bacterium]|jgi:hypothetical protein|nr:DUF1850 domain-containing protein [Desulfobacteraceae bacterium]
MSSLSKGPGRRRAFAAGLAIVAAAAVLAWLPGGLELRVVPVSGGKPLLVLPLQPGERFTLHYYHSVENAPIWEEHSLDADGRIYIEEERYLKLGAGMGRTPGVGRVVQKGPYTAIVDMHRPTGNFILRVGRPGVVDHTVIWRDTRTNLSTQVVHQAVQFTARPVSLGHRLLRRFSPHPQTPSRGVANG